MAVTFPSPKVTHFEDILPEKKKNPPGFYYAGFICKLLCVAFANRPTDNFGETAANLLQHKSPLCILSSLRVLNFAVEEDIAHIERLPAITSSHILAQSEVSRMRRYRSALQHLNTSSVWSTKAMVVQKYKAIESPGLPIILSNTNAETWWGAKEGGKSIHFWWMSEQNSSNSFKMLPKAKIKKALLQ